MNGFACDFDGTLYFKEESPSIRQSDIEAIHQYQREGNLFGICTGRPLSGILAPVNNQISFDFYIVSSGALVLDSDRNVLYSASLDRDLAIRIHEDVQFKCKVAFQVDDCIYCLNQVIPEDIHQEFISNIEELPEGNIFSLSLRYADEDSALKHKFELEEKYGTYVSIFQNKRYLDVVSNECSKGKGIQLIRKMFDFDVLSGVGDSLNDIPMFEEVDVSFGIENGASCLYKKCNYIVGSVCEALKKEKVLKKT